jgi:hypothetical protein
MRISRWPKLPNLYTGTWGRCSLKEISDFLTWFSFRSTHIFFF